MTIHAAMGDTLLSVATTISVRDTNFFMWDKGQLIVILSRTKLAKNTIVVGQKEDTLKAFRSLVCKQTQWSDHMEAVLDIITLNRDNERETKSDKRYCVARMQLRVCLYANIHQDEIIY